MAKAKEKPAYLPALKRDSLRHALRSVIISSLQQKIANNPRLKSTLHY